MCNIYQLACNLECRWLHEFQLLDLQGLPSQRDWKQQLLPPNCDVKPDLVLTREVCLPPVLWILFHHKLILLDLVFNLGYVVFVSSLLTLLEDCFVIEHRHFWMLWRRVEIFNLEIKLSDDKLLYLLLWYVFVRWNFQFIEPLGYFVKV